MRDLFPVLALSILIGLSVGTCGTEGRPDIRIVNRTEYASVDGAPAWELGWTVNGMNQAPAMFRSEEERERFEEYLGTVGRVSE